MADEPNIFEEGTNYAETQWRNNVSGQLKGVTNDIAEGVEKATKNNLAIPAYKAKEAIPMVAAAAVGVATLLLPLDKIGKFLTKGLRQVITGFGLFEKIPVLGSVFKTLGNAIESTGQYAGYGLAAAAAYITHSMMGKGDKLYEPAHGEKTTLLGTGAKPREPDKAPRRTCWR